MNFYGELVYFSINVVFFFIAIILFYKFYNSLQFKIFLKNNETNNETNNEI